MSTVPGSRKAAEGDHSTCSSLKRDLTVRHQQASAGPDSVGSSGSGRFPRALAGFPRAQSHKGRSPVPKGPFPYVKDKSDSFPSSFPNPLIYERGQRELLGKCSEEARGGENHTGVSRRSPRSQTPAAATSSRAATAAPQPQAPRSPSAQAPRSPPSSFLHSASPSPSSGLRGESPLFAGPELQFCYSQINFFFEGKMTGLFNFFKGQHTISSIPEVFISTNEDEKT